jgi:hypothetical protein
VFGGFFSGSVLFPVSDFLWHREATATGAGLFYLALYLLIPIPVILFSIAISIFRAARLLEVWFH